MMHNISVTMRDRRLVTKDHLQVTTHCRSCGHATDDITWPKTINDDNITRWKNLYHRWPTRATMVLSVKERTLIVKQSTAMGQVPCSMEHIFSCFFLISGEGSAPQLRWLKRYKCKKAADPCVDLLACSTHSRTSHLDVWLQDSLLHAQRVVHRDCNPGPFFPIPGFGIEKFLIPGSRRD